MFSPPRGLENDTGEAIMFAVVWCADTLQQGRGEKERTQKHINERPTRHRGRQQKPPASIQDSSDSWTRWMLAT